MDNNKLIYTAGVYLLIIFINYKLNTSKLTLSHNAQIEDKILTYFTISFVLYSGVYIFNIILGNEENNSSTNLTVWSQINYEGFLFITCIGLYLKIMPLNIFSIILYGVLVAIYYPLIVYIDNYIYNGNFTPNINDLNKAVTNIQNGNFIITPNVNTRYKVELNPNDLNEIMISFQGTDPNNIEDVNANLNLKADEYKKEFISNKTILNDVNTEIGIHEGYLTMYFKVRNNIYSRCKELISKGANKIFISGYSLGASLSTICAFDINANIDKLDILPENITNVHIGGPAVGNQEFIKLYNKHVINSTVLVHINDPVPKIDAFIYQNTKNKYVLFSNAYSVDAHDINEYKNCIVNIDNNYNIYIRRLLFSTPILIILGYLSRDYYIKNGQM